MEYIKNEDWADFYEELEPSKRRELMEELLKKEDRPVFILPNYTAMMEVRAVLTQETGNKEFWE